MGRALLSLLVADPAGAVQPGARVVIYEEDGQTLLGQPLYAGRSGSATLPNPLVANDVGRVVAYCETPQRAQGRVGSRSVVFDITDDPADLAAGGGGILPGSVTSLELADGAVTSAKIADGTIESVDIADGTIGPEKLSFTPGTGTPDDNTVTSAKIVDGAIVNVDINSAAGIAKSKLEALEIVNADVNASAAIVVTKLAHLGTGNVLRSNGTTNVAGQVQAGDIAAGVLFSNPMTTTGDVIIGGASGAPTRMAKGANSTYLRVSTGGNLEYGALPVDPGFANPMTTSQDLIVGGASGAPARLAKGANGTVLGVDGSGNLAYTAPLTNPMTTVNDIIIGGASGAATRMAKGANSTYLRVSTGGNLEYGALPVDPGFANPMTTAGDVIVGGASGAPTRQAKGANSTVLGVDAAGAVGYTTVTSAMIADGAIVNADVNAGAAIAKSKLAALDVVNADVNAAAGIAVSKLAAGGTAWQVPATADGTTMAMQYIVGAMITEGSVHAGRIQDGSITTVKLGDSQVTSAKLAANAATQSGFTTTFNASTASTSYGDASISGVVLTTTGGDLLCHAVLCGNMVAAGNGIYLALSLDGATQVAEVVTLPANALQFVQSTIHKFTAPAAGSHTVKVRWRVSASTFNTFSGMLLVVEAKR